MSHKPATLTPDLKSTRNDGSESDDEHIFDQEEVSLRSSGFQDLEVGATLTQQLCLGRVMRGDPGRETCPEKKVITWRENPTPKW